MSKQNRKNKKANNIGTAMHTVSYLGQPYIKSDYKNPLTLQEIVDNQYVHKMLIPRSEEDQAYIEELESYVVKNVPDEVVLKNFFEEYCARNHTSYGGWIRVGESESVTEYYTGDKLKNTSLTSDEKLNLLCNCHNCHSFFPLRNLKWVDHPIIRESDQKPVEYYDSMTPMCAKYPICPSSWSFFDIHVLNKQYSLEDHKKGKYDR
jgi:hypothetical protein